MADIGSSRAKLNTIEVNQDKPITQALMGKIGGNINYLIDERDTAASRLTTVENLAHLLNVENNNIDTVPQLQQQGSFSIPVDLFPTNTSSTAMGMLDASAGFSYAKITRYNVSPANTINDYLTFLGALPSWDFMTFRFKRQTASPNFLVYWQAWTLHTVANV